MAEDTELYAGAGGHGHHAPVPDVVTRVVRVPALARAVADVVQVAMVHGPRLAARDQPAAGSHAVTVGHILDTNQELVC